MFTYNFYRFVGTAGNRSTELVRDHRIADGVRSLVDQTDAEIKLATEKVISWGKSNGITLCLKSPHPSMKYPSNHYLNPYL